MGADVSSVKIVQLESVKQLRATLLNIAVPFAKHPGALALKQGTRQSWEQRVDSKGLTNLRVEVTQKWGALTPGRLKEKTKTKGDK